MVLTPCEEGFYDVYSTVATLYGTWCVYIDDMNSPFLIHQYVRDVWDDFNSGFGMTSDGFSYIGFTAGTGGNSQNHDLLSWSFQPFACVSVTGQVASKSSVSGDCIPLTTATPTPTATPTATASRTPSATYTATRTATPTAQVTAIIGTIATLNSTIGVCEEITKTPVSGQDSINPGCAQITTDTPEPTRTRTPTATLTPTTVMCEAHVIGASVALRNNPAKTATALFFVTSVGQVKDATGGVNLPNGTPVTIQAVRWVGVFTESDGSIITWIQVTTSFPTLPSQNPISGYMALRSGSRQSATELL